jgi:hypothetical protein
MQRGSYTPQSFTEVPRGSRILKRDWGLKKLMNHACSVLSARLLLILLNVMLLVAGVLLVSVGMWAALDKRSFVEAIKLINDDLLKEKLNDIVDNTPLGRFSLVLVILGASILTLSLLGYFGAAGERRYLLNCYAMILLIILLLEVAAAYAAVVYKSEAENTIKDAMKTTLNNYLYSIEKSNNSGITLMWDRIMANFECCGVDNSTDFEDAKKWVGASDMVVPDACCLLNNKTTIEVNDTMCTTNPTEENSYKDKGCYDSLAGEIEKHTGIPILIVTLFVLSQALGMVLAYRVCKSALICKAEYLWNFPRSRSLHLRFKTL